ncbi:hypothetical protein MKZ38_004948 [Zalerion maritima]|uniref:Uncharacterized protein n=1 Tax=Zalerion maritima TaxID=339359 RepID=A0AAD5WQL9_9PEZI|nr:hypothetical protein MKZ38_004948 [Zalerion maritima]
MDTPTSFRLSAFLAAFLVATLMVSVAFVPTCEARPVMPDKIRTNHWINATETSSETHSVAFVNTTEWVVYRHPDFFTHPTMRIGAPVRLASAALPLKASGPGPGGDENGTADVDAVVSGSEAEGEETGKGRESGRIEITVQIDLGGRGGEVMKEG